MTEESEKRQKQEKALQDQRSVIQWLAIAVMSMAAGGGGSFLYQKIDPPRLDPFTGAEGSILEASLSAMEFSMLALVARVKAEELKTDSMITALRRVENSVDVIRHSADEVTTDRLRQRIRALEGLVWKVRYSTQDDEVLPESD